MNRLNILMITIVALILVSCKKADEEPSRAFYTNFSIGKIVDKNKDYLLGSSTDSSDVLLPGSRTLTGAEAGPSEPFIQRATSLICNNMFQLHSSTAFCL